MNGHVKFAMQISRENFRSVVPIPLATNSYFSSIIYLLLPFLSFLFPFSLSLFFHLIDERANFHRGYLASSSSGSFRFLSIRIEYIWREGENEYRDEYTFILGNSWCSVEYWCPFSFLIPAEPIPIFLRTIPFLYLPPSLSFFYIY